MSCSFFDEAGNGYVHTDIDTVEDAVRYVSSEVYVRNSLCPHVYVVTSAGLSSTDDTEDNDYIISIARIIDDMGGCRHSYDDQLEKANAVLELWYSDFPELTEALSDIASLEYLTEERYDEWRRDFPEVTDDFLDDAAEVWGIAFRVALPDCYSEAPVLEGFDLTYNYDGDYDEDCDFEETAYDDCDYDGDDYDYDDDCVLEEDIEDEEVSLSAEDFANDFKSEYIHLFRVRCSETDVTDAAEDAQVSDEEVEEDY